MKDYLEKLEIGEEGLTKEQIKGIIAEASKMTTNEVTKAKAELESQIAEKDKTIKDLGDKIKSAPSSDELESLKTKITEYEQNETKRIEAEKIKAEDVALTNNIMSVIEGKKFVNDYTKNAIINDIKSSLKDTNNAGKSAKDLFEELTKDKDGIFEPENKLETPPMGEVEKKVVDENHARELLGLDPIKK